LRRAPSKEPPTAGSRLANRSLTSENSVVKYVLRRSMFLCAEARNHGFYYLQEIPDFLSLIALN
jgi:hypothetical protein